MYRLLLSIILFLLFYPHFSYIYIFIIFQIYIYIPISLYISIIIK